MSRFVLDATGTMAWCFIDEAMELTETLLSRLSDLTDCAQLRDFHANYLREC